MEYLRTYTSFNEDPINEGLKSLIKKYGFWLGMGIILIPQMTPDKYKDPAIRKMVRSVISYKIDNFKDYKSKHISKSLESAINKVKNSNNIENKEYVISRLQNVIFKIYEETIFMGDGENNRMSYFYDGIENIDYIFANYDGYETSIEITHELNHLIDEHKIDKKEIDPSDILNFPIRKIYLDFFEDWPTIDYDLAVRIVKSKSGHRFPKSERISIGDILYSVIKDNEDYLMSDSEVYARLSSMKAFMIEQEMLGKDKKNEIRKVHTEALSDAIRDMCIKNLESGKWGDESILTFIFRFDFMELIPLINWEKKDDLNLISLLDKDSKKSYLT